MSRLHCTASLLPVAGTIHNSQSHIVGAPAYGVLVDYVIVC